MKGSHKKFVAHSMAEAFKMIKQQFGHDALILSHDYVDGKIEVLAAPSHSYATSKFNDAEPEIFNRNTMEDLSRYNLLTPRMKEPSAPVPTSLKAEERFVEEKSVPVVKSEKVNNEIIHSELEEIKILLKENFEKLTQKSIEIQERQEKQEKRELQERQELEEKQEQLEKQEKQDTKEPLVLDTYLKSEIETIKILLKAQAGSNVSSVPELPIRQNNMTQIRTALLQKHITPVMINQILADVSPELSLKDAWDIVIHNFAELISFDQDYLSKQKKIKAFVGPSGVGKTQSMAKLVTHYIKNGLDNNFAFIFVNNANIKVLEESRAFGRIFNVPSYYVESYQELEDAYIELLDKDYVFIDFPSFDFNNTENNFYMKFLEHYPHDMDNTFVISSYSNLSYIEKHFSIYDDIGLDGLTITKLDENNTFEEIIEYAVSSKVPIRNLSFGQDFSSRFIFGDKNYFIEYFRNSFLSSNNNDASKESVNNEKRLSTITPKNGQNSGRRSHRRKGWGR